MTDETDYSSLPLGERLTHKVWKVRLTAYDELSRRFDSSPQESEDYMQEHISKPEVFKKYITDPNVVAQESGIKSLMKFLEVGGNPSIVSKLRSQGIILTLCEKALSSSRKNTKDYTIECLLLFTEVSNDVNGIVEDILSLLKHRLPKLVSGCVSALAVLVDNFGCGIISPKSIIPHLEQLFGHADRNVRLAATELAVELYKWMKGALVTVLFPSLKPVQQKDLKKAFESIDNSIVLEQKRLTRSQKAEIARKKEEEAALLKEEPVNDMDIDVKGPSDYKAQENAFDPYDLIDPVEVLSKFPSDLMVRVNSDKWKDRKEVLEEVHAILEKTSKLAPDDYSSIVRVFAKCMKDANLQVVQLAANCIEFLCQGLKKDAAKYIHTLLGPIIERTKEKKASTATALADALDALFSVSSLSEIIDDSIKGMKHKTPQVKIASSSYLQRCLAATTIPPTGSEIEAIMEAGVKLLSDSQEPVRHAATELIGTLMKITEEKELKSFLDKIDDNRKNKVIEFSSKVEVKCKSNSRTILKESSKFEVAPVSRLSKRTGILATNSLKPTSNSSSSIPAKRGATSPVKRPDDVSKVSSFGRGLTGRSLVSPVSNNGSYTTANNTTNIANNIANNSANNNFQSNISSVEKDQLMQLRREKESFLEQKQKDSQIQLQLTDEKLVLNQELSHLRAEIENLSKDHNNSKLMLKQKDTQISRLNSDLENAKLKIRDLEQTVEMMKLQRNQVQSKISRNNLYEDKFEPKKSLSPEHIGPRSASGELSSRVKRLSIDGERLLKENADSHSINGFSRHNSPHKIVDNTNTFNTATGKELSVLDMNDDSWKRAAEVTSQLKARIEKMKARSRTGINFT